MKRLPNLPMETFRSFLGNTLQVRPVFTPCSDTAVSVLLGHGLCSLLAFI